jgi:hydroxymethylbilane synthase
LVGSEDGQTIIRTEITGHVDDAEILGIQAAENLLAKGAGEILTEVYGRQIK